MYFDREIIESVGKACIYTINSIITDPLNGIQAENEVLGNNISTISAGWMWLPMKSSIIAPLDVSLTTTT